MGGSFFLENPKKESGSYKSGPREYYIVYSIQNFYHFLIKKANSIYNPGFRIFYYMV